MRNRQLWRAGRPGKGAIKIEMGQGADISQGQDTGRLVASVDVRGGPIGGGAKIKIGIGMR